MTPTYDLMASNVLTSSASSITFSSIPATYRDLVLVMATDTIVGSQMRINNDSSSIYNRVLMFARTTGASSLAASDRAQIDFDLTDTATRSLVIFNFLDYAQTNKQKSILIRTNADLISAMAGRVATTAAITSIEIFGTTYAAGSSFYLYGISA